MTFLVNESPSTLIVFSLHFHLYCFHLLSASSQESFHFPFAGMFQVLACQSSRGCLLQGWIGSTFPSFPQCSPWIGSTFTSFLVVLPMPEWSMYSFPVFLKHVFHLESSTFSLIVLIHFLSLVCSQRSLFFYELWFCF